MEFKVNIDMEREINEWGETFSEIIRKLDVEIYEPEKDGWAQARYLVHGHNDVLWTDDIDAAVDFLRESMEKKNN